jgi:LysM repeat protein
VVAPAVVKPFVWPAVFLAAATIAVVGIRSALHNSSSHGRTPPAVTTVTHSTRKKTVYVVRAGDTLAGVAAKTGVSEARLLELNPSLTPTALFLGQRIKLR